MDELLVEKIGLTLNTNKIKIFDIKTSKNGWKDKEKKDELKMQQIILYKEYFAKQYNIDPEQIDVEFFVVKRKLYENLDFPQKRIQIVEPASGKGKRNKAVSHITEFINTVESLSTKYGLFEPISIKISKGFDGETSFANNENVKISYHTADIHFKTLDPYQLLNITHDLRSIIPQGSVVLSSNLRSIDALTPEIINELTPTKAPELLEVKIKILLRDIVYEK